MTLSDPQAVYDLPIVSHMTCVRPFPPLSLQEKYFLKNGGNLGGDSSTFFKGANFVFWLHTNRYSK